MKNTKRKAFTLVELLVVIAIIGILFVVLISKVDFATEKSKASGVQTDFRSYQLAIETVARENAGLSTLVDDDASGAEKYAVLEAALNKNLDPKLRVEIDENGNIATDAKDPWKEEYTGQYLAPDADGTVKDRGAIVMYSNGSNLKLGSTAEIANGVVNITIESGKETEGADDYSISAIYTYVNGYGEIKTTTDGFSNNMGDENTNQGNNTPANPGDPSDPDNGGSGEEPVQLAAGLYTDNTYSVMAMSWQEMTDEGIVSITQDVDYLGKNHVVLKFDKPEEIIGALVISSDEGITEISNGLSWCETLTGIVIPNGVLEIWSGAFMFCTNLESVILPDSITTFQGAVFMNCSNLTSINIPENLTNIGYEVFDCCDNLDYNEYAGIRYLGSKTNPYELLIGPEDNTQTEYTIHEDTKLLGTNAFNECRNLTGIDIPSKVRVIGNSAFSYCSSLTSIDIPDSTTHVGEGAFSDCSELTSVNFGSGITDIKAYAFSGCSKLTNIIIPEGVTELGNSNFMSCSNLESVTLPSTLEGIDSSAFFYCTKLNSVTFNGTVEQWNELMNNSGWSTDVPATYVQCSDGQVPLQ